MLNNFCFHVYAQKSLSHSLTLTLSIFLTLTLSQLKIDNHFKQTCRLRPNDYTFPILCISSVTWHVLPSPDNKTFLTLSQFSASHFWFPDVVKNIHILLCPPYWLRRDNWSTYRELTRTGPTLSCSFSSSMRSATLMNFCSSSTSSLIAVDVILEQQF